jgi:hypothetical protein
MLGSAPPIRNVSSRFAETRYIGFELKEQCTGERYDFLPLQMPRGIHILNVHVVR